MTSETAQGVALEKHQAIVEKLRDAILANHNRFKATENVEREKRGEEPYSLHEVKKLETRHFPGTSMTFVVIEVGLIGDEGTMASALCRDYRHIMIKKRGGLELLNAKRKSRNWGFWNCVHELTR